MNILQIIQSIGFPAACVIGMAWYVKYITDQHREDRNSADTRHREEMHEVTAALNNNTLAIQKLTDYIKYGDEQRDDQRN